MRGVAIKAHESCLSVSETDSSTAPCLRKLFGRAARVCDNVKDFRSVRRPLTDTLLKFPELGGWELKLHGTDINLEVLAQARAGRYSALEVNRGLPALYLARYMERDGTSYVLSEKIRKRASFDKLNFVGPWPVMQWEWPAALFAGIRQSRR